tara:strand:- start:635 stop:1156 length:522 start_codon:yes stop_codon:yes gene_type:complete
MHAAEIIHMYLWSYMDYKRVKQYFENNVKHLYDASDTDKIIMITTTYEPFFIIYVNRNFENVFRFNISQCLNKTPKILRGYITTDTSLYIKSIRKMLDDHAINIDKVNFTMVNYTSENHEVICKMKTKYIDLTHTGYEEILETSMNCFLSKETQTINGLPMTPYKHNIRHIRS